MPSLNLPQDVINEIIHEMGYSMHNQDTLETCSLVSSAFRDSAQRELFKRITISYSGLFSRSKDLYEGLLSSPRLSSYIEHISFGIVSAGLEIPTGTLPKLIRLRHIRLWYPFCGGVRWASLASGFRSDLCQVLQRQTLHSLAISNIRDFPLQTLCKCISCGKFNAGTFMFGAHSGPGLRASTDSIHQIYLRELALENQTTIQSLQPDAGDRSSAALSMFYTRRFETEIWNDESLAACRDMLEFMRSSVEELQLTLMLYKRRYITASLHRASLNLGLSTAASEALSFDHLHNLHNLTLVPKNTIMLSDIPHLLRSLPDRTGLTNVTILSDLWICELDCVEAGKSTWRLIDEVLTRARHATWMLCVHILTGIPSPYLFGAIQASCVDAMPRLLAAGHLNVELRSVTYPALHQVIIP